MNEKERLKRQVEELEKLVCSYRRALIRCGMRTQYRDVYDIALRALKMKSSRDLIVAANEEGVDE